MQRPPDRPWVIAHRGASGALRENTLAAFREAYARGADAVEMDVRRTADGALVIHHDPVLTGAGPIVRLDLEDVEEIAPWVPDLDAAVSACAGMWMNVEIKNSPSDPDWDPDQRIAVWTIEALRDQGVVDRVLVSSFNPDTVRAAVGDSPGLRTGWLAGPGADPLPLIHEAAAAGCTSIHPDVSAMRGAKADVVVEAAARAGLRVIVWTVDDEDEIRRLAAAGVDGIITNHPGRARSALEHRDGGDR
jgi:glycerophosphoryl diester phosphodiesterase